MYPPRSLRGWTAKWSRIYFGLLIYAVSASCLFAFDIPEKPRAYVHDDAGVLSSGVRSSIENQLIQLEKDTSNQVVVAIFESIEGGALEDVSIRMAQKWKIGTKERDNGVLILFFMKEHLVRIEVGYGLEGALTDALASQIIRDEIIPQFRKQDFDAGVRKAVEGVIAATRGEYRGKSKISSDFVPILSILGLFFFFIVPILASILVLMLCVVFLGLPLGLVVGLPAAFLVMALYRLLIGKRLGQTVSRRGHGNYWTSYTGFGGGGHRGGGGFSGGGGSFGGGGASGRW